MFYVSHSYVNTKLQHYNGLTKRNYVQIGVRMLYGRKAACGKACPVRLNLGLERRAMNFMAEIFGN